MSRKKYRSPHPEGKGKPAFDAQQHIAERRAQKQKRKSKAPSSGNPISIPKVLIILAYILITTFTPNLMALDTNTPKFAALALMNLLTFIYLLSSGDLSRHPGYLATFFTTKTGLAFAGLLLVSLLSFTQSINLLESVVQFSKLFTVFSAAFILSVFFTQDLRLVRLMAIFFTGVLLFDAFSVFYYISEFIGGNIAKVSDIKSVYSNKNILASALFVKIPFALWMMVYEKGWLRRIAWFAVMTGIAATFFMVARAFYVGLIIVTILFTAYTLINYYRDRERQHLYLLGSYMGALLIALAIFSITQQNFYPGARASRNAAGQTVSAPSGGRHTQGITQQIASITAGDSSSRIRLRAWNWSLIMIKSNPLLGVGIGNWKVSVLEHENKVNRGFIYSYKSHNDFLETGAETGIPGFLLYLAIYIFVGWAFLMAYFHREQSEALYKYLFLAASGLIFFSFDAMFNFPHDRPEMMILFSAYVATGISASYYLNKVTAAKKEGSTEGEDQQQHHMSDRSKAFLEGTDNANITQDLPQPKSWMIHTGSTVAVVMMIIAAWVLYINFLSSKTQRIAFQEIRAGQLQTPSDEIIDGLPILPNLSVWGESLRVLQARYLIHEEKYEEAIEMLTHDQSNPFDARREYFMAMSYLRLDERDSVVKYTRQARALKPFYLNNMLMLTDALEKNGETEEVKEIYDSYLAGEKGESRAWIATTNFYQRVDDLDKAVELIDEAIKYLPGDDGIKQQHTALNHRKFIAPHAHILQDATEHYRAGRYQQAINSLNEYLAIVPDELNGVRLAAFCHYHLQNHALCIEHVNKALELGQREPSLINLRGASYRALGDMELACKDFEESMNAGNASGIENYKRFCTEEEEEQPVPSILRQNSND